MDVLRCVAVAFTSSCRHLWFRTVRCRRRRRRSSSSSGNLSSFAVVAAVVVLVVVVAVEQHCQDYALAKSQLVLFSSLSSSSVVAVNIEPLSQIHPQRGRDFRTPVPKTRSPEVCSHPCERRRKEEEEEESLLCVLPVSCPSSHPPRSSVCVCRVSVFSRFSRSF